MKKVETEDEIKAKGKMVAITTIVSFIVVVGFVFYLFSSIRSCAKDSNKKTYYILDSLELEEDKKEEKQIDLSIIIFIISAICLVSIMIAYGKEKKKNEDNNV